MNLNGISFELVLQSIFKKVLKNRPWQETKSFSVSMVIQNNEIQIPLKFMNQYFIQSAFHTCIWKYKTRGTFFLYFSSNEYFVTLKLGIMRLVTSWVLPVKTRQWNFHYQIRFNIVRIIGPKMQWRPLYHMHYLWKNHSFGRI